QAIRLAGATYLGELDARAPIEAPEFTGTGTGAATLSGRVSIEAASRGATHFHSASSNIARGAFNVGWQNARFVLYRLPPSGWDRVPSTLRPEGLPTNGSSGS